MKNRQNGICETLMYFFSANIGDTIILLTIPETQFSGLAGIVKMIRLVVAIFEIVTYK